MRRILWATTAAALLGLPVATRAEEPGAPGLLERGRNVVQACFHKRCDTRGSCASPCDPCGGEDIKIGKLIDTLFHAERACDRKWAALKLDEHNWANHPEIVAALTYAMQSDCDRNVRIAAADSLKDMRVSEPDAIGAMRFTREADPSCRVRYKAKWGIIKGERSRPPCLTYVSGYGAAKSAEAQKSSPILEPAPAPKPEPEPKERDKETGPQAKRPVRSFLSSAMAKVRSRS